MEKERYEPLLVEIIAFEEEDVIVTSTPNPLPDPPVLPPQPF